MSHSSRKNNSSGDGREQCGASTPTPRWMVIADRRRLEDSIQSLTDAFNDIESIVLPLKQAGVDLQTYRPDFVTRQRLSSDFITLYNECEFLELNYHAKFNSDDLAYLRHLRKLCAHRFGSSMDDSMFLIEVDTQILRMKGSIKSKLYNVLDENPGTGMEGRVESFNKRPRRWFRRRRRIRAAKPLPPRISRSPTNRNPRKSPPMPRAGRSTRFYRFGGIRIPPALRSSLLCPVPCDFLPEPPLRHCRYINLPKFIISSLHQR